ncbi:FecR family protein [Pseudomonas nitroreducens]|uniref:Iron dicitrate transport regulator FecR n=1 Tax=Pseudomonas nitroreducens TaxID=46680 RepID=A0A246F6S0_PSENT|nr:FecR family protein [Pseudomonas nitroreducens]OWP48873.1 iron dicitrate transport regulator FecR [Pseudomonas nitroreducens]
MKPVIATSPEDAQRQARQWLLRLQDRGGEAWLGAFQAWLAADPRHARAYAEVDALWRASAAPAQRLAAEEGDALNAYLAQMDRPATRRMQVDPRRWCYPLASAACLLLMLWGGGWWSPGDWVTDLSADYVSAPGEVREVTLDDGSRLTLDADSAVAVSLEGEQRRVDLLRGAASFAVKHLPQPFMVRAGEGEARVLGTEFEVRRLGEQTRVTVAEGRVSVRGSHAVGGPEVVLGAGERVGIDGTKLGNAQPADAQAALAWREGWLTFYRAPLGEVLARLGTYYPGRIVLLDQELAQRRVSGSFRSSDPQAALDSLQAVVGFRQQPLLGRFVLIR